ncbi:MAG: glycosyltransferase [Chitinophagales bacterium]|nr:glycosyltransferase [Chitinophagales bacterium]
MIVTHILSDEMPLDDNVFFSIYGGDAQYRILHKALFLNKNSLTDEYKKKFKDESIDYKEIHWRENYITQFFILIKSLFLIIKMRSDVIVFHTTTFVKIAPIIKLLKIKIISINYTSIDTTNEERKNKLRYIRKLSNFQIYLTADQYNYFEKQLRFNLDAKIQVCIISKSINTLKFSPNKAKKLEDSFKILMWGRFNRANDFQTIIRATAIIERRKLFNFHVYLAGDGDTFEECITLVKQIDIEHRVTFLGMLSENELIQNLRDTYLYVHSSLSETMSTAIMQAMSCGISCLVSDIPGNKTIIEDGVNGWLFKTGDVEDLAKKIDVLMALPQQVNQMSIVSRTYAVENFNMKKVFESYCRLF